MILKSVRRQPRVVIRLKTCGLRRGFRHHRGERYQDIEIPIRRITLPDIPAPAGRSLESNYYVKHPGSWML